MTLTKEEKEIALKGLRIKDSPRASEEESLQVLRAGYEKAVRDYERLEEEERREKAIHPPEPTPDPDPDKWKRKSEQDFREWKGEQDFRERQSEPIKRIIRRW